jgi:hypothetical protein
MPKSTFRIRLRWNNNDLEQFGFKRSKFDVFAVSSKERGAIVEMSESAAL